MKIEVTLKLKSKPVFLASVGDEEGERLRSLFDEVKVYDREGVGKDNEFFTDCPRDIEKVILFRKNKEVFISLLDGNELKTGAATREEWEGAPMKLKIERIQKKKNFVLLDLGCIFFYPFIVMEGMERVLLKREFSPYSPQLKREYAELKKEEGIEGVVSLYSLSSKEFLFMVDLAEKSRGAGETLSLLSEKFIPPFFKGGDFVYIKYSPRIRFKERVVEMVLANKYGEEVTCLIYF